MDLNQQVQEEEELTEIVCQEADLKDGQWVCTYWQNVYLQNNILKPNLRETNPWLVTMQLLLQSLCFNVAISLFKVIHIMCWTGGAR